MRVRPFRLILLFVAATGLSAPALAASPAQAGVEDFVFESFHADYLLDRDAEGHSTLTTTETIVAIFPDVDQNRGIIRAIPNEYLGIDVELRILGVEDEHGASVPYEEWDGGSVTELALGTDEFVHGRTSYVISYTQRYVTGSFDDTGADEFYWDVNGTGWRQPFGEVSARLTLGEGLADATTGNTACYRGILGATESCEVRRDATGFSARVDGIEPFENLTIAVGFDRGTFTPPPDPRDSWIVAVAPWALLAAVLALLVTVILVRALRWRDAPGRPTRIVEYTPPDAPIMTAAALLGRSSRGLPAQIVDLAVSRCIRLLTDEGDYAVELRDRGPAERPGRRAALQALFAGAEVGTVVPLHGADMKLGDRIAAFRANSTNETAMRPYRARIRSRLPGIFLLLAIAAVAAVVAIGVWAEEKGAHSAGLAWLLGLAAVTAVVAAILAIPPKRLTSAGSELRDHLLGLRDYLVLAEADRLRMLQSPEGAERTDAGDGRAVVKLYERLLPYAVLWGVEREWAGALSAQYAQTPTSDAPAFALHGDFGSTLHDFSDTLAVRHFITTPVPSSSGSSWSGSSGSSFSGGSSGGGFSGGGGGGGGGGGR